MDSEIDRTKLISDSEIGEVIETILQAVFSSCGAPQRYRNRCKKRLRKSLKVSSFVFLSIVLHSLAFLLLIFFRKFILNCKPPTIVLFYTFWSLRTFLSNHMWLFLELQIEKYLFTQIQCAVIYFLYIIKFKFFVLFCV